MTKTYFPKLLAIILAISLIFCFAITAAAQVADHPVAIAQSDTVTDIQMRIQTAIDGASAGDTVTVSGSKTGISDTLSLDISDDVTVVWQAEYAGTGKILFRLTGEGTFEVAEGGAITASGDTSCAIYSDSVNVKVGGGAVIAGDADSYEMKFGILTQVGNIGDGFFFTINGTETPADPDASQAAAGYNYKIRQRQVVAYKIIDGSVVIQHAIADASGLLVSNLSTYDATETFAVCGTVTNWNSARRMLSIDNSRYIFVQDAYCYNLVSAEAVDNLRDLEGKMVLAYYDINGDASCVAVIGDSGAPNAHPEIDPPAPPAGDGMPGLNATAIYTENGNIDVTGGTVKVSGIFAVGIESGGNVNINGGLVRAGGRSARAINVFGESAIVTVSGSGMVAAGGYAGIAINAYDGASVNVDGGTVQASGDNSRAIDADSDVSVSGGVVSSTNSVAISVYGIGAAVTVNGGRVLSAGSSSNIVPAAISVMGENSSVTVSDGSVQAITGDAISIIGKNITVTVDGGTVDAANSAIFAFGTMEINSTVTLTGGTVSATTGTAIIAGDVYVNKGSAVSVTSTGRAPAIVLHNGSIFVDGGDLTVNGGIVAGGNGIVVDNGAKVTVNGNIDAGMSGVYAGNDSIVTVIGNIEAVSYGVYARNATVNITGVVTALDGYGVYSTSQALVTISADMKANDYAVKSGIAGIWAWESGAVTITGDIISDGNGVNVYSSDTVTINGNISGGTNGQGSGHGVSGGGTKVIINGNVKAGDYALYMNDSEVTLTGNIEATGMGVIVSDGTELTIEGNIKVVDNGNWAVGVRVIDSTANIAGTITVSSIIDCDHLYGVYCMLRGTVNMAGDINVDLPEPFTADNGIVGIVCNDSTTNITGSISVVGVDSIGVTADNVAQITVDGLICASTYINVSRISLSIDDFITTSSKPGYKEYTDGTNTVWVKDPLSITVSGQITYQPSPVAAKIELLDSADKLIDRAYTNQEGAYTLTAPAAPAGTRYTIVITKPGYLSYTINNITLSDGEVIEEINFFQLGGDVDGNGVVNAADLTYLLSEFNRSPINYTYADIDGNGIVNAADLTYLLAGFDNRDIVIDKLNDN